MADVTVPARIMAKSICSEKEHNDMNQKKRTLLLLLLLAVFMFEGCSANSEKPLDTGMDETNAVLTFSAAELSL